MIATVVVEPGHPGGGPVPPQRSLPPPSARPRTLRKPPQCTLPIPNARFSALERFPQPSNKKYRRYVQNTTFKEDFPNRKNDDVSTKIEVTNDRFLSTFQTTLTDVYRKRKMRKSTKPGPLQPPSLSVKEFSLEYSSEVNDVMNKPNGSCGIRNINDRHDENQQQNQRASERCKNLNTVINENIETKRTTFNLRDEVKKAASRTNAINKTNVINDFRSNIGKSILPGGVRVWMGEEDHVTPIQTNVRQEKNPNGTQQGIGAGDNIPSKLTNVQRKEKPNGIQQRANEEEITAANQTNVQQQAKPLNHETIGI